ncbi:MAG: hypothetical protein EG824_01165 [Deltaproteobacteria bacterium]|nr:hypothetical protein [Deltaproteobacteria bacterium]
MSDWSQLSLQEHELNYILKKFGKKESEKNRQALRGWEKKFKDSKGGQQTKLYTKDEFYDYIKGKVESSLE